MRLPKRSLDQHDVSLAREIVKNAHPLADIPMKKLFNRLCCVLIEKKEIDPDEFKEEMKIIEDRNSHLDTILNECGEIYLGTDPINDKK